MRQFESAVRPRKPAQRPAVFLDRDGTIIEDLGFISDPEKISFYPSTVPALRRLGGQFELFIVTNQSGIAKGALRPADVERVNDRLVRTLAEAGIAVRKVYCCPHETRDGCECKKPSAYYGLQARREHGIELERSFVVGDHPTDVQFAANLGAHGIYVLTGHGEKHRGELDLPCPIVDGIGEAVQEILLERAVDVLRHSGLVAFPTETVYGLGANAENESAVRRIFEVKGRPHDHPLIVHAADPWEWTAAPSLEARRLADKFWPGPLTLILKKSDRTPTSVTGGQATVGVRVPSHPCALELLKRFGGGIAAPSANRFGKVSPTTAGHVLDDLGDDVDFILDGGVCEVGVESTIVDLSGEHPAILRPGGVTREEIEQTLGRPVACPDEGGVRAPGRLKSHYAPKAKVLVARPEEIDRRTGELRASGLRVDVIKDPQARELYSRLREADSQDADVVLVAQPLEKGLGLAVADRLRKASHH